MKPERVIAESAFALASSLPALVAEAVADAILTSPPASLRAEISKRVPHHHHRDLALGFVERWQAQLPTIDSRAVAIALQTASLAEQAHRDSQSVELVWTGPDAQGNSFRRTEQAILQLLDAAQKRITLVSFAVYSIPNVARALVKAASRGVKLNVIVETPDKLGGENEYSTIRALGEEVADCATVYYWALEKRPLSENNKPGILHVKCAVADGHWMFLSSANLTQQAFTVNMELGILLRGGMLPQRVEMQFDQLIRNGQLQAV